MAFSSGNNSITIEDVLCKTTEADILFYYLHIRNIPCVINSPLRKDSNPSFGLYSKDGKRIFYTDLSTKDKGGLFDLLGKMWNCSYIEVLERVYNDIPKFKDKSNISIYLTGNNTYNNIPIYSVDIKCKIREWRKYDIEYWESFGISLKWLKYAEVYPISHKIIIKNEHKYIFGADKYAYAYVEHKEGKTTLKIYQPFNKNGYKWCNKHDNSVISLWTKVPKEGNIICICSSLKDALCLWANTEIPSIAVQGEGYNISNTAINELKKRFKHIFILFDNDNAGLIDGEKLAKSTGFKNIVLPKFNEGKDISDLYKSLSSKEKFKEIMMNLFINNK